MLAKKKKTLALYTKAFLEQQDLFHESLWVNKFFCKLMVQGKKHLVEKYVSTGLIAAKYLLKKVPAFLLMQQLLKFRPVVSFTKKRMGRKFNSVPKPIKERRRYILALTYIVKYIKNVQHKDLNARVLLGLSELFTTKKNALTRKIAEEIKHLSESRIYLHLRWK